MRGPAPAEALGPDLGARDWAVPGSAVATVLLGHRREAAY